MGYTISYTLLYTEFSNFTVPNLKDDDPILRHHLSLKEKKLVFFHV